VPLDNRVELLRWKKTRYQSGPYLIVEAVTLSGETLVVVGEGISWGEEGLFMAELKEERHARYGQRWRVLRSRPVDLAVLLMSPERDVLKRHLPGTLQILEESGHTAYPLHLLSELLSMPQKTLEEEFSKLPGVKVLYGRVGYEANYLMEQGLISSLKARMIPGLPLKEPEGHTLSERQRQVFQVFQTSRVGVLTGGPGTGKSYTVATFLRSPSLQDRSVALAAPTGKAAKRMEELSGRSALTVHRLLGYYVNEKGEGRFRYHASNPLPHHAVIVDESSMLDLPTFHALVSAVSPCPSSFWWATPTSSPPWAPGSPSGTSSPSCPPSA